MRIERAVASILKSVPPEEPAGPPDSIGMRRYRERWKVVSREAWKRLRAVANEVEGATGLDLESMALRLRAARRGWQHARRVPEPDTVLLNVTLRPEHVVLLHALREATGWGTLSEVFVEVCW